MTAMGLLARYLTELVLTRFAVVLIGLAVFLLSLDLMVNAEKIIASRGGDIFAALHYSLLRLPDIASTMIKFASLLAGLLTFSRLMHHNEVAPIWGAGVSQFGVMTRLLPVSIMLGLLQFGIDDRLIPAANAELRDWNVVRGPGLGSGEAAWFQSGDDIVRIPFEAIGNTVLRDVIIFQRDTDGDLTGRLDALQATYEDAGWILRDVTRREAGEKQVARDFVALWETSLDPTDFLRLTLHPKDLTLSEMRKLVSGEQVGYWVPHYYATWANARVAVAMTPALMLFLIVALAQRFQRMGHIEMLFAGGLGAGFGYFILSGLAIAMGQKGLLPPLLAGWVPVLAFAIIIATIALWREVHEESELDADGEPQ